MKPMPERDYYTDFTVDEWRHAECHLKGHTFEVTAIKNKPREVFCSQCFDRWEVMPRKEDGKQ